MGGLRSQGRCLDGGLEAKTSSMAEILEPVLLGSVATTVLRNLGLCWTLWFCVTSIRVETEGPGETMKVECVPRDGAVAGGFLRGVMAILPE